MEEISGSNKETETKSTNDRKSPGQIIGPLGYREASAEDDEANKMRQKHRTQMRKRF